MSARPARAARWIVIAVAIAVVVFIALPSREENVRSTLIRAAEAVKTKPGEDESARRARLERELSPLLAPDVRIDVPGISLAPSRDAVLARLIGSSSAVIQIDHIEVRFDGSSRAEARFDATVSDSQAGDLHGDARRARAELRKLGSDWVIASLSASPEERAEPEARP